MESFSGWILCDSLHFPIHVFSVTKYTFHAIIIILSAFSIPTTLSQLTLFPTATKLLIDSHKNQHLPTLIVPPLSFFHCVFVPLCDLPCSSLFLSRANSTSTGQLDKLGSPGLPALTPESEEERSLPPQRVSTFRPRPYSMADSNKVRNTKPVGEAQGLEWGCPHSWPWLLK